MSAPTLRPYQQRAIDAVHARWAAGDRSTLLVMPTGTGKTVVFAELARQVVARGGHVLVLAHRTELLEQAVEKMRASGLTAAVEQAGRHARGASVVVASVQTMRGERLQWWSPNYFDLVVVDEAHHAPAPSYQAALKRFAKAKILGVTATPDRLDGLSLKSVFQSCADHYDLRLAVEEEWLVPIRAKRIEVERVDLTAIRTRMGDLDTEQLAEVMQAAEALHGVAKPLVDLAGSRKTIVYTVNVAHAHALAGAIN